MIVIQPKFAALNQGEPYDVLDEPFPLTANAKFPTTMSCNEVCEHDHHVESGEWHSVIYPVLR
jgi:hypothetical protein